MSNDGLVTQIEKHLYMIKNLFIIFVTSISKNIQNEYLFFPSFCTCDFHQKFLRCHFVDLCNFPKCWSYEESLIVSYILISILQRFKYKYSLCLKLAFKVAFGSPSTSVTSDSSLLFSWFIKWNQLHIGKSSYIKKVSKQCYCLPNYSLFLYDSLCT